MTLLLTQREADLLFAMEKHFRDRHLRVVTAGKSEVYELYAKDSPEIFHFNISRGRRAELKFVYQTRARTAVVLARLCVNSSPHTNPDKTKVGRTHLHLYRENHDDRFAIEIDPRIFSQLDNPTTTLLEFCKLCNINSVPTIQMGLF